MVNALKIHPTDMVAVALVDLVPGTVVLFEDGATGGLKTVEAVPFGHKVALRDIAVGETIIKYGASIGVAFAPISAGQHVHTQNLKSVRGAAR